MAMRVGLREVLNSLPGLKVISSTARLDDLSIEAEVLVMVAPAELGKLRNEQAVLYLVDNSPDIVEFLRLGFPVWGVLPINASEAELNQAILALAEGLWVGTPTLLRQLFRQSSKPELDEFELSAPSLTIRETEVLQLAAQGLANKQIASKLGISEHTIKFHLSSLYAKLGASNRTEAIRTGVRKGIVVL